MSIETPSKAHHPAGLCPDASHYSERALYRRLKLLYSRLGVRGRTEAVLLARDEGWL